MTQRQVLRKSDVAAAAAAMGVAVPELLRSAVDVPTLHRPWCLALAAGLLRVADGCVSSGPATWPTRADEVPSAWLAGLRAACAAEVGPRGDEYDAIGRMLVVLTVLGRDSVPEGDALWFAMKDEALEAADEFDLDWTFTLTNPDQLASVVALLHAFGAVDAGPVLTLQKTVPLDPGATYPVGVSFAGESPEEYEDPDEPGEPAEREPFTLAAVNRRLAVLAGRLPPAASLWVSSGPRLPSPGPPARPSRSSCPDAASRSPSVPVRRWVAGSPHLFEEDRVPLQNSPLVL